MIADGIPPDWIEPGTLDRAREVQRLLAERVVAADAGPPPRLVAGVDVSNAPRDPAAPVHAAVVLLDPLTLAVAGGAGASGPAAFPYVPGFLGFREIPQLLRAFRQLEALPDLILVDGHGISHPRSLGIASQLGVVLDRPTIGVAKSILVGRPEGELGEAPGSRVPLVWRGREIGAVLRTKRRTKPVYVSVGHLISLDAAVRAVLGLTRSYRLPEPTRQAHLAANARRRAAEPDSDKWGLGLES